MFCVVGSQLFRAQPLVLHGAGAWLFPAYRSQAPISIVGESQAPHLYCRGVPRPHLYCRGSHRLPRPHAGSLAVLQREGGSAPLQGGHYRVLCPFPHPPSRFALPSGAPGFGEIPFALLAVCLNTPTSPAQQPPAKEHPYGLEFTLRKAQLQPLSKAHRGCPVDRATSQKQHTCAVCEPQCKPRVCVARGPGRQTEPGRQRPAPDPGLIGRVAGTLSGRWHRLLRAASPVTSGTRTCHCLQQLVLGSPPGRPQLTLPYL